MYAPSRLRIYKVSQDFWRVLQLTFNVEGWNGLCVTSLSNDLIDSFPILFWIPLTASNFLREVFLLAGDLIYLRNSVSDFKIPSKGWLYFLLLVFSIYLLSMQAGKSRYLARIHICPKPLW